MSQENEDREKVVNALGGKKGLIDSGLPSLAFVFVFTITRKLDLSLIIALAIAAVAVHLHDLVHLRLQRADS